MKFKTQSVPAFVFGGVLGASVALIAITLATPAKESPPAMYYTTEETSELRGLAFETGFSQGYMAAAKENYPTFEAFEQGLQEHRDRYLIQLDAVPTK